jgi:PAS domain S-box-containing protein
MPSEQNNSKEQKTAEVEVESFRKNLGPFVVAAETTRMAMVFTDAAQANHPFVFANESFLSLTGYDRKEVLGQSFNFLMVRPPRSRGAGASRGRIRWRLRKRL